MCPQAGEGRIAPSPALRGAGAQDAMLPAAAPTGRNVTLRMDPACVRPAGRGRTVSSGAQ